MPSQPAKPDKPFRWTPLLCAAPLAALITAPLVAVAQSVMASGDKNREATEIFMIGGWIMMGGIALFCLLAFALSLTPQLRREK